MKITVYSLPDCPKCDKLKEFLKSQNIDFEADWFDTENQKDFVMMNIYSSCGHDAKVGKYCILSPYATLNGFVVLEDEVFLGTHTTVIPYKRVGCKSKISANSVVMRDVATNKIVFGVPGKAI